MIRRAKVMDVGEILMMALACGAAMRARGIFQWNEAYPSEAAFLNDVARGELWVWDSGSGPVGCLALSERMDSEYQAVSWETPDRGARYVHRLAVHPNLQRRGLGARLMDFAEDRSRSEGATAIRLDTFSRNEGNQRFYAQRGYKRLGAVYFPNQSAYPFYCYELALPTPR